MFAGGPGFSASYTNGDAELLSDVLCSYPIDPHGSGSSTPPADPADYSPEGHARFYEQVRQALALPKVVVLGHSFGATTALTYAALYPQRTAVCVAVAAFSCFGFVRKDCCQSEKLIARSDMFSARPPSEPACRLANRPPSAYATIGRRPDGHDGPGFAAQDQR